MPHTDSEPVTAGLTLVGLWLHDPADPEGTSVQFPYGRSKRSTAITPQSSSAHYAGRRYPVVDHGDLQSDSFSVTVEVPNGPDHDGQLADLEGFAQARRTLVLRDNRGRRAFGHLSGYAETDQDWGTAVGFVFTRLDYDEGELVS